MANYTADQLKQKYANQFASTSTVSSTAPSVEAPSISSRIATDLSARKADLVNQNTPGYEGVGGAVRGILHNAGTIAGGLTDIAGEAVASVDTAIGNPIAKTVGGVAKTAPVKASVDAYGTWKAQHPEAADALESFVNVASIIPVGAGVTTGLKTGVKAGELATGGTIKAGGKAISAATNVAKDVVPTRQAVINHQVSRALDLTPGDLNNIARSTGNDVGTWVSEKNLIGKNKAETQANIDSYFKQNHKVVRDEIGKVKTTYKASQIPRFTDALTQINKQLEGVPGLEKAAVEVDNLLHKTGLKLSDVQRAKELLDNHFSLYKVTGDVGQGAAKEGLNNIRRELKSFIEREVKNATGADIAALNNNVATARSLSDAIITRAPKGLTRSNLKLGDLGIFGIGMGAGGPLVGAAFLFAKKVIESSSVRLRVARYLDKKSDAAKLRIKSELEAGNVPTELNQLLIGGGE